MSEDKFKELIALAEKGVPRAQNNLGRIYVEEQGVQRDNKATLKWFTLAAKQGSAVAQFNLGVIYENGHGVPKNYAFAYTCGCIFLHLMEMKMLLTH